jgi:cyanophycinase-like exopeptidase
MPAKGSIVLMGSGELTATMVEVYKNVLGRLGSSARAAFLDTPAGFQLNADQISVKAVEYFRDKVGQRMVVASFKSNRASAIESEKAFLILKQADLILVGPGSPTYAVRQWTDTPIPEILIRRIEEGACFVAASAAALTIGPFTIPVYEIYKVGMELHWVQGIHLLGRFGMNLVVVPHWNNAEGGTHDTRFCFMGESRFRALEAMLPEGVHVLGVDEHTACIIDLATNEALVRGLGNVTLRRDGSELILKKNTVVSLDVLKGLWLTRTTKPLVKPQEAPAAAQPDSRADSFWDDIHDLESNFEAAQEARDAERMSASILDLDRLIWKSSRDLESEEFVSQARELLREWVVMLGTYLSTSSRSIDECLGPLVEELLKLRDALRREKRWEEADALRDCLQRARVIVEDTGAGVRWRID